jgi:acylphosphatase
MLNFSNFEGESQDDMKHLNIVARGRVQGVGFRYSVHRAAESFQVKGFVKNLTDGSVYIEAEAEQNTLELFLDYCRKGPGLARVDQLLPTESDICGFKEFRILH